MPARMAVSRLAVASVEVVRRDKAARNVKTEPMKDTCIRYKPRWRLTYPGVAVSEPNRAGSGCVWKSGGNSLAASSERFDMRPTGRRGRGAQGASVGIGWTGCARVCQPSTFRIRIYPEARSAQSRIGPVSGPGSTVCVLIRRRASPVRPRTGRSGASPLSQAVIGAGARAGLGCRKRMAGSPSWGGKAKRSDTRSRARRWR